MCEIFPEVSNCCYFFTIRVGMLFIGVLSVITGALILSIIEQHSDADFDSLKNVTGIRKSGEIMNELGSLIKTGISGISVLFMFCGLVVLFSTLTDQPDIAQFFVWVTFVNVLIGFIMVIAIIFQCMIKDECLLSSMDWLSGSAFLVIVVAYLFGWVYFITVVNSYATGVAS